MACTIYTVEIEGGTKLGYMARPRGGDWLEEELRSAAQRRFDVVVSLLQDEEAEELALTEEARLCAGTDCSFSDFPFLIAGCRHLTKLR